MALHSTLYMATNPRAEQKTTMHNVWIPAVKQRLGSRGKGKIVLWDDVKAAAEAAVGAAVVAKLPHGEWAAAVEMCICALAGAFEGSWGSTFSGWIHRMRGYMPAIADKRILYHNSIHNNPADVGHPTWANAASSNDVSWAREYSEGWEL